MQRRDGRAVLRGRSCADLVAVVTRGGPLRGVDDHVNEALVDKVHDRGFSIHAASLRGLAHRARRDAVATQHRSGTRGRQDREAHFCHTGGRQDDRSFIGVGDRDEHRARCGHIRGRTQLRLGEGRREVAVDAHHLAGRTHLGTEDGVDDLALVRAETLERQDRGLDGDRSAVVNLARVVCGQKALLTQGRDRITHLDEGRGLGQLHAGRLRGEGDGAGGAADLPR